MFLSDAGGVGLNLQRAASCCINLELPWNPAVLEQRIGRIYRLGQKLPIDVYNLVTEDGIEARIAELVGNKQALFTGLFDGTSDAVRFERPGRSWRGCRSSTSPRALATAAAALEQDAADDRSWQTWPTSGMDDEAPDPFEELIEAGGRVAVTRQPQPAVEAAVEARCRRRSRFAELARRPPPAFATDDGSPASQSRGCDPRRARARCGELFSQLQVRRNDGGGITIEAPAEAASTLGALLEGVGGATPGGVAGRRVEALAQREPRGSGRGRAGPGRDASRRTQPTSYQTRARRLDRGDVDLPHLSSSPRTRAWRPRDRDR